MPDTGSKAGVDRIGLGVGAILGTVFALSLGDALIKFLGGAGGGGLWQLFVLRSLLVLPILGWVAMTAIPTHALVPRALFWVALRSVMLVMMWVVYYIALPLLPLAVAAAGFYTLPLFIVVFAAVLAKEPVRGLQWFAVGLGFVGIVLILRPGGASFHWAAILPVFSALLYALAMVLTRAKCREDHPLILAAGLNLTFVATGLTALMLGAVLPIELPGFLTTNWVPLAWQDWRAIGCLAVLILIASVGTAFAYQTAPSALIGTFDFAYVGFAVIWGVLFFGERPDALTFAGLACVVVAGCLHFGPRDLKTGPGRAKTSGRGLREP